MMMSWISQAAQAFCADSDNGHLQALQCARVLPVDPIFNLTVLVRSCFLCYARLKFRTSVLIYKLQEQKSVHAAAGSEAFYLFICR
jgi:hypothetical protein